MGFDYHAFLAAVNIDLDILNEVRDNDHSGIIPEIRPEIFETGFISLDADDPFGPVVQVEECGFSAARADVKLVSPCYRNEEPMPVFKLLCYPLQVFLAYSDLLEILQ